MCGNIMSRWELFTLLTARCVSLNDSGAMNTHGGMKMQNGMNMDDGMDMGGEMNMTGGMMNMMDMGKRVLQTKTSRSLLTTAWSMNSIPGLTIALIVTVLIAIAFEGFQEYQFKRFQTLAIYMQRGDRGACGQNTLTWRDHFAYTGMHLIHVTGGYFLMLTITTYNVWMLVAITTGAGIGFCLLRPAVAHAYQHRRKIMDKRLLLCQNAQGNKETMVAFLNPESKSLPHSNGAPNDASAMLPDCCNEHDKV